MNDKLKPVGNNASSWAEREISRIIGELVSGMEVQRLIEIALLLDSANDVQVTTNEVRQLAAISVDYLNQSDKLKEVEAKLTKTEASLKELQQFMSNLRMLCGYVEDGSDTVLKIFQDDACREWFAKSHEGEGFGSSIFEAINNAAGNVKDLGY